MIEKKLRVLPQFFGFLSASRFFVEFNRLFYLTVTLEYLGNLSKSERAVCANVNSVDDPDNFTN